jgi:hypothetical protein
VSAKAKRIGDEIRQAISKTLRDVMLLAEQNVSTSTPVDTGHAMSNWILSVGSPHSGVDGSRADVSFTAQARGRARVQTFDVGRDKRIYLRNNVPYVQYLDRGSSQQAPAGFVARAMAAALRKAPYGRKGAVRKMLRAMAKTAYKKGV